MQQQRRPTQSPMQLRWRALRRTPAQCRHTATARVRRHLDSLRAIHEVPRQCSLELQTLPRRRPLPEPLLPAAVLGKDLIGPSERLPALCSPLLLHLEPPWRSGLQLPRSHQGRDLKLHPRRPADLDLKPHPRRPAALQKPRHQPGPRDLRQQRLLHAIAHLREAQSRGRGARPLRKALGKSPPQRTPAPQAAQQEGQQLHFSRPHHPPSALRALLHRRARLLEEAHPWHRSQDLGCAPRCAALPMGLSSPS
mmetsp:Transcript_13671/g.25345  ORF Transcript_13671/g.25345 Transcript_13671/m.25345 type:complete len:252 (-) Transcript_13671:15-770(-)